MVKSAQTFVGRSVSRRGIMLPALALSIVAMVGFLALAIDVGMLAIAKTQAQNAADLTSLTAARTLNGNSTGNYNQSAATTNAKNILTYNVILGTTIPTSQLTLTYGSYDYNQTTQAFGANYPPTTGVPTTAVTATITTTSLPGTFSKIFGSSLLPNVTATAQAAHRPRDLAMVMDLSSSMRYGTMLGFDITTTSRVSNNPDTVVPTFGAYSGTGDYLTGPSTNQTSSYDNYTISPSNTTTANSSYSLTYINGFYQNAAYASTLVRAFDSYTSTNGGTSWSSGSGTPQIPPASYATTPGGDVPLFKSGSTTTYAQTVNDVVGSTTRNKAWELDGYSNYAAGTYTNATSGLANYTSTPFYGYTKGPGYYGKTFFLWPPDPRRPLNTKTATTYSSTASDISTIQQFLTDFGYAAADTSNSAFTTTLSAAISSTTATSVTVNSTTAAHFPSSGQFRILIGSEILLVTAGAGTTTWTVTRHMDSTTAATHTSGTTVGLMTSPPLSGLYTASGVSDTPGLTPTNSQTWPWPNDTGTALSTYLTTTVYIPVSVSTTARLLQTTDAAYQKIMRLYNWNYVVDNVGTTPCDWRIRFFGTDDNTVLFQTSGSNIGEFDVPQGNYTINYNEILRWLTQTTDPFPTQLRAGRVKYYGSIPTAITGTWPNYGSTDQQFWVEVIDHMLGFRQSASGQYTDISNLTGYGDDFTWGTVAVTAPPSATQYMSYSDNPQRPNLRHWFSPILMVDYLHNYNLYENNVGNYYVMQPGDSYEAPIYTGRQAFLAAINTIENNHPNDWFSLVFYSEPRNTASDTNRFNNVASPLGTNYEYAKSALFFPFSTINADGTANDTEVTPYDSDPATGNTPSANFVDTPRPKGNTCFAMGLMLAHNQFAVTPLSDANLRTFVSNSPITFPTAMAGGMGRKGAQKVIIFETDGLANTTATASLLTSGSYSYYNIRYDMNKPSSSQYPSTASYNLNDPTVTTQVYSLVDQVGDHLRHDTQSVPALRHRLRSRLPGVGRQLGTHDVADHAIPRGHPDQCLHRAAVEPDHHGDRYDDVREHG